MKTLLKNTASAFFIALSMSGSVLAQETIAPAESAASIALQSDQSDNGFASSRVELSMLLRNAQGQETSRALEIRTLEREDGNVGDKSVVLMHSPRDVKGTAFLSHAKLTKADDQWIFLPALRRVKRIASANKSGPFLGSEFAYEDFTSQEFGKYSYTFVKEEACGERICDVVERLPLYELSGYSRQLAWIDQQDAQYRKIEFFDRAGSHVKTLEFDDYRRYQDTYWRAHSLEMTNHRNGKFTSLTFGDFVFGEDLSERDFVKGSIARLR
jgi:hypothetical protein